GGTKTPEVNFKSNISFNRVNKDAYELMDAPTFAKYINMKELADNLDRNPKPIYTEAEIKEFQRTGGTDWLSKIFRPGVNYNNALSISGMANGINYLFSGDYLNQKGTVVESGYKRYILNAKLEFDIRDWADINISWRGIKSD